jgi:hypothetical protein
MLGVKADNLTNSYADCLETMVASSSLAYPSVLWESNFFTWCLEATSLHILYKVQKRTETLNSRVRLVYVVLNGNHKFFVKRKALRVLISFDHWQNGQGASSFQVSSLSENTEARYNIAETKGHTVREHRTLKCDVTRTKAELTCIDQIPFSCVPLDYY